MRKSTFRYTDLLGSYYHPKNPIIYCICISEDLVTTLQRFRPLVDVWCREPLFRRYCRYGSRAGGSRRGSLTVKKGGNRQVHVSSPAQLASFICQSETFRPCLMTYWTSGENANGMFERSGTDHQ